MSKEVNFQSNSGKFENVDLKKWSSSQSTNDMQRQCSVFLLKCGEEKLNLTKGRRPKWKLPIHPLTWHLITEKDCEESPPSWWLTEVPSESEYQRIADMIHPTIRETLIEPFHVNSPAGQLVYGLPVHTYHQPKEHGRTVGMVSLCETSSLATRTTKLSHDEYEKKLLLLQKLIESFIHAGIVSKSKFLTTSSRVEIFKERAAGTALPIMHCIRALAQGFKMMFLMMEWTLAINKKQDHVHSFVSKLLFHLLSENSKFHTVKMKKMIGENFQKCKIPKLLKMLWKWTDRMEDGCFDSSSIQPVKQLLDQLDNAESEDNLTKADGDLCSHVCNASEALLEWIQSAVEHPSNGNNLRTGMPEWLDAEVKKLMLNKDEFPVEKIQATFEPLSVRTVGVSVDPLMFAEDPDDHLLTKWTLETQAKLSSSDHETLETISRTMETQGEKLRRIAMRKSRTITDTIGSLASTEADSDYQRTRLTLHELHQFRAANYTSSVEGVANVGMAEQLAFLSHHQRRPSLKEDHHHRQSSKDADVGKKSPTTAEQTDNGSNSRGLKFSNGNQQQLIGDRNKVPKLADEKNMRGIGDGMGDNLINYGKLNFHNAFVDNFLRDMEFLKFDHNNQMIIRSSSEKVDSSSSSSSVTTSLQTLDKKTNEEEEMKKE
ncbi:hypothetical protein T03_5406 [Trichinella britovi]|uniref:Uncharacterized protein n=1 Tax=Trichinella britovi TaxID=45882 RepID=A0A0V1DGJ4_TRIBR|nr:hypothetical protein T03_5406 [Trichinella britovi]